MKNGALVKLSFNYNKQNIKSVNIYPGRNMDKMPKKKPKILIKSISMIRLNQKNQDYNKDNNEKKNNRVSSVKEFPVKGKRNIILGFKKSLFTFNKKKINSLFFNKFYSKRNNDHDSSYKLEK